MALVVANGDCDQTGYELLLLQRSHFSLTRTYQTVLSSIVELHDEHARHGLDVNPGWCRMLVDTPPAGSSASRATGSLPRWRGWPDRHRSPLRAKGRSGSCGGAPMGASADAAERLQVPAPAAAGCALAHGARPRCHWQFALGAPRSGQDRFITRPKSRTMRAARQLMLPPSTVS